MTVNIVVKKGRAFPFLLTFLGIHHVGKLWVLPFYCDIKRIDKK
jgi:hypothetical protein